MSEGPRWLPVLILLALLGLAYLGMWRGWRRRGRKHDLLPLVETPAVADLPTPTLEAGARYFGTTTSGSWLDRVVDASETASLSRNTPYAGRELPGRVVATFLRGKATVLDGKLQ